MGDNQRHVDLERISEQKLDTAIRLSNELRRTVKMATEHYDKVKLAEPNASHHKFPSAHSDAVKRLNVALQQAYYAIDATLLRTSVTDQHQQLSATHQPARARAGLLQDMASAPLPVSRVLANRSDADSHVGLHDTAELVGLQSLPATADIASMVDRYTRTLSDKIYQLVSEKMTTSVDDDASTPAADCELDNSSEYNTKL